MLNWILVPAFLIFSILLFFVSSVGAAGGMVIPLSQGWQMASSERTAQTGAVLSSVGFQPQGWYPVSVPTTVLAGLVENGVYPDPYFGRNWESINGADFNPSWWFHKTFTFGQDAAGMRVWLVFEGINYSANIWVNGTRIAATGQVFGPFRTFEFDITPQVQPGGENTVAVEVFQPGPDNLAIHYVDWAPRPKDGNMGLYRNVSLKLTGPVRVRHPHVVSVFDLPSLAAARLTASAEVENGSQAAVSGVLKCTVGGIEISLNVQLAAGEKRQIVFDPGSFPQLVMQNPRVWWPADYGDQPLYDVVMSFETGDAVSDMAEGTFGIRQVTSRLSPQGHRIFQVNGRDIMIKGAGWCPDLLQRFDPVTYEHHIRYVRDMNLNTIRLEGKFEDRHFYDLCDRYGILLMAGWCCCDKWEQWGSWNGDDHINAYESTRSKILEMRSHPSMLVWLNGSDNPPPRNVEQRYMEIIDSLLWPNPVISNATAASGQVTGPSGVKMEGPYEWVPPNYWQTMNSRGGAFGLATEIGPGPSPPPVESLRRMLPENELWPAGSSWNYHCGGGDFSSLEVFNSALSGRHGAAKSLEDYARKAQIMAYESHRAMFEGYQRNKYTATGVIQWMLNNGWPSMIWHLYDYYLRPGGSYFGAKKASEPLHIQYSYDDRSIHVLNATLQAHRNFRGSARVYHLDGSLLFEESADIDIAPDGSHRLLTIPDISEAGDAYILRCALEDSLGKAVSLNTYWLSRDPDILNAGASTWFFTPVSSYADLTALQDLPPVTLVHSSTAAADGDEQVICVSLRNPSLDIAFSVEIKILRGVDGQEVLPVLKEDNYFTLLPGESREVSARFYTRDLEDTEPVVKVEGWNVAATVESPLTSEVPEKKPAGLRQGNALVRLFNLRGILVWQGQLQMREVSGGNSGRWLKSRGIPAGFYSAVITQPNQGRQDGTALGETAGFILGGVFP